MAAHSPQLSAALEGLLATANGRRRARVLTLQQVLATADQAWAADQGLAIATGGTVADAREHTTLCLAVREGSCVTVGVGHARANEPNPGQIWRELAPWQSFDDARNQLRCRIWARRGAEQTVVLPFDSEPPRRAPVDAETLLAQVLAKPDDDAPREIYRDWLLEHGDERGELIALQLTRERLSRHDPQWEQLTDAESTARSAVERQWLAQLPEGSTVSVRRGFVEHVTANADAVVQGALDALFAAEPVTSLRVLNAAPPVMSRLASWPGLARLQRLELVNLLRSPSYALRAEQLGVLLESDRLRNIRELQLRGHDLSDAGALVLAANVPGTLPQLERFHWLHDELSAIGAEVLFGSRWFSRLRALELTGLSLDADLASLCAHACTSGRLQALGLSSNPLGDQGAVELANAPTLHSVRSLSLRASQLGPVGTQALLDSPSLRNLQQLDLGSNRIGAKMAAALKQRFELREIAEQRRFSLQP